MSQVTSQNALVKDSTVQTLNGKLDNLNATLGGNTNIAPVFNTATAYSKGDMVNYNGALYVFTANHSAGAWTGSDAVQTKVSSELSSLRSGLTNYSFTDSITTHAQWVETSISDVTNYAGKVIYGYMTDTTLGRTYTFVVPVNNIPQVRTPIWVQHDLTDTGNTDSIFAAKSDQTNALCIFLGSNIPDMTVYLFVH